MKIILLAILCISIVSCTTIQEDSFKRVNVDQYYRQSGMVKYFHSDLPKWANLSSEANCQRTVSKKFLKINHLMDSFALNYEKAVHLQALFNFELQEAENKKQVVPTLKEEEGLFFKSLDKINAGIRGFKKPSYKRLNIVWLDSYQGRTQELKELMNSATMNTGRPILVTMCMSKSQVRKTLLKKNVILGGARIVSFEYFNFYSTKGKFKAVESLDLNSLLNTNSKKYFYYTGTRPRNIQGNFIYRKTK